MNDEMEMIEEFQSESIEDLVVERRKEKAVQHFLTTPSSTTRYYHIANYSNGDSIKSEVSLFCVVMRSIDFSPFGRRPLVHIRSG